MSQTATERPMPAVDVLPECSAKKAFELYDMFELLGVHLLSLGRAKQRGEDISPESYAQLYQLLDEASCELCQLAWVQEKPDCSLPVLPVGEASCRPTH